MQRPPPPPPGPPSQSVLDGDLCETFARLPFAKQKTVATALDRTPAEVLRKLEDLRNKIA
jgi:splicing factor 3B subunit 3